MILMQKEVDIGLGKHITNFHSEEDVLELVKINLFFQMTDTLCVLFTKISICFFILRFRDDRKIRWILSIFAFFMTLSSLACIIVLSLACQPLKKFWTPQIAGHCQPLANIYIVGYVQSGFTIVTDLGLSLVPVWILWRVQIKPMRKFQISLLMSLGLIATIANALRNPYQRGLTSKDFTRKS